MALGPVMCDLHDKVLSAEEKEILMHPLVGGVILFTRNFESPEQLAVLCQTIHELRQPHLIIAVDHEGGRVQRFREGFSQLPACHLFSQANDEKRASLLAEEAGWLMAAELLAVGVDLSFAPVLDIGGPTSEVIGDRAFDTDPETITKLARAYMRGMKQAGMAAVGKHFPGHGSVREDSHIEIPKDEREFQDIKLKDLIPFERMIHAGLPALMPAHVIYSKVDSLPAGFSSRWLIEILRGELEFQGTIFSDDLSMKGAEVMGGYTERAEAAMAAGCDMVLACNNQNGAIEILDNANIEASAVSRSRLIRMHGDFSINLDELKSSTLWKERNANVLSIDKAPQLNLNYE
ncbi:MAG: beta-N-acetylhexosaminidase [Pseudomonadota bacterium]